MATLNLNSAARALSPFTTAGKVRAKIVDGTMFIRPTDRKAPVNLPKGEKLVDMQGGKLNIEGLEHGAGAYGLQAEKYGWFALTADVPGRGPKATIAA